MQRYTNSTSSQVKSSLVFVDKIMEVNSSQILNDAEVHKIVKKTVGENETWKLIKIEERKAFDGVAGFQGDHRRLIIQVDIDGQIENIYVFLKLMPTNEHKVSFLEGGQFFQREVVTLSLIEKIATTDPYPWCTIAYLSTEKKIVMPDVGMEGYRNKTKKDFNDLPHALLAASALARFHAAFANYETARKEELTFTEEYGDQFKECIFIDSKLMSSGTLLHKNFLKTFSEKYSNLDVDLLPYYLEACKSVTNYEDTLNTLIHRDLWSNNFMFKYENDVPVNALLIDFQMVRYAPPAFDIMIFLYMSTSKTFKFQHGETLLRKYFDIFMQNVNEDTKQRLKKLKYDWTTFREWCEKARMFAMVCAMIICPIALIDGEIAEKVFNNMDNFEKLWYEDRTEPIVECAKQNPAYKELLLNVFEEFVDTYVSE